MGNGGKRGKASKMGDSSKRGKARKMGNGSKRGNFMIELSQLVWTAKHPQLSLLHQVCLKALYWALYFF